jgi:hypothetical protein
MTLAMRSRARSPPERDLTGARGLGVVEEEVLEVGHHMAGLAADQHLVGGAGDAHQRVVGEAVPERGFGVEPGAGLVEDGDFEVGAKRDGSGIGRGLAGEEAQERGLADAVGAHEGHAVAAHDAEVEVLDDRQGARSFWSGPWPRSRAAGGGPASSSSAAVPWRRICEARSARSAARARTRPWLRLRRAEMPSTAHFASALILRSSLWRASSSSAQTVSRQSSKPSKPDSRRRTSPRSIHRVALDSAFRKARSWR